MFTNNEISLLEKWLKYKLHNKKKNWPANLALEAETAITRLPNHYLEFYRRRVAERIETQHDHTSFSKRNTRLETQIMKSYKQNSKNNSVMIAKVDKGNPVVVIPFQQYETKIQNFLDENSFHTCNTYPTNTFQNQIRKTINNSKIFIPQNSQWKCISPNPSAPTIKGLIKIHKPNQPIRPIVNWRNAPAYKLSKLFIQKTNQLSPFPCTFNIKTLHI